MGRTPWQEYTFVYGTLAAATVIVAMVAFMGLPFLDVALTAARMLGAWGIMVMQFLWASGRATTRFAATLATLFLVLSVWGVAPVLGWSAGVELVVLSTLTVVAILLAGARLRSRVR